MNTKTVRNRITFIISILLISLGAQAAPLSFVYQGQIIKPDQQALEAASVNFTIQVLSPAPSLCVLFEETHNGVNMSGSNGIFALPVGSGTVGSGHYANLDDAFDNSRGSESPATCDGVAPYDANPGDTRVLRVTFDDGGGPIAVSDQTIRSVPFAQYASKVDGLSASDLVQVNTTAPAVLSQANLEWVFETTRYAELQALINGTSSQYMVSSPSSAVDFNGQIIDNIAAPADANDATNKNYVDTTIGGQNADALVSAPTIAQDGYVLGWNNTTSEYELIDGAAAFGDNLGNHTATSNVILGSNYISNDGTASQGLSFDGSNNANFSQNLTVSQGFSVTNGINSAGNIEIQNQTTLRLGDADNSDHVILQAPATVTSYTMQLPNAASPAAGRVLKSDASGNLIWATDDDTGGDITSGSSVGAGGVDVYKQENAGILEFKSINSSSGSGLSITDDVVNDEVDINIDIAGVADETVVQGADTLLIRDDDDSGNIKEMTRTNFVLSEAEVDAFVGNNGYGDVAGAANVGGQAGELFRDEVTGTLNFKTIGAGSTRLSVTNNANDISLDVVEANINHDNLSGFVANEHIDHSGVSIATAADSGLSGGGDITTTRNLSVDVNGTTAETAVAAADELLIYDDSATALRKMTHTNFLNGVVPAELSQVANIDAVTISNAQWGYLGAMTGQPLESETDPKMQTLSTAEVDQLENIDAVTISNAQWGYLGAMTGQPLESESDTLATVTGRGASTTDAITVDGAADAVQLTIQGHSTQTTNVNILELENSAGTVIGSFRADGVTTATTDLATKSYVDAQIGSSGDVTNASNEGTAGVGAFITKNSGVLEFKNINAGSSKVSVTNDGANNEIDIDVVEANIDHDSLSGFVANEHVDHSSVSVATAADSGLSGGGDITATRNLSVDITGTTAEASIANGDELLIYDSSATALRKMTYSNFVSGLVNDGSSVGAGGVDVYKQNNSGVLEFKSINSGAGIAVSNDVVNDEVDIAVDINGTTAETSIATADELLIYDDSATGIRKITHANFLNGVVPAELSQVANIDAVTISNAQWGYLGAMTGQPLESESDTLAAVTGRGASTTDAITIDGAADAVQLTIQGHSTQTTNVNILELENSAGTVVGSFRADGVTTAGTDLATKSYVDSQIGSSGDVTNASNEGTAGVGAFITKNSGVLEFKNINAGSSKVSVTNDGANNEIDIDVVEANIDHDSLSGFVANEHVDHSSVSIATAADSGLSGGGDITSTRNLAVDVNGTTAETTVAGADELLLYDASATALRKMTRTNFVLSESEVDAFVGNNGYLTSESDPGLQTLTTAEVDQLENIDSTTISATQWGYLGAMGGQPLESESDTLAAVTGRGASTTDAITIDGAADAVQLTIQGHSTQTTNVNILELENSAGTVVGSFRADGATTASTDLATKSYVDSQVSGSGDVSGAANVGGQTGELFRDEVTGTLNFKTIGAGSTRLSVTNNANDISLDVVEANINHDNLSGFVANEHVDHSSVSIATAADSGLSGGGDITSTRNLAVNINGTTAESSIASGDELLIYDASATALRKMTYTNFVSGLVTNGSSVGAGGVDVYKQNNSGVLEFKTVNNGAGIAISNDVVNDEVDVAVDINGTSAETTVAGADELLIYDASATGIRKMTRTNFVLSESEVDAFVGNNGYLTSESDTLAAVTGRGASTTDAITIDGAADAVQLTIQGHSTQTTNVNILELENSAGTVVGSFRADGTPTAGTDLATKTYVDGNLGGSTLNLTGLSNGQSVRWNSGGSEWEVFTPAAGGEANDGANVGSGAGQIYKDKTGTDINFKTIAAGSTRLSVTNNTNDVTLDVVEANINHDNLSGFVANEHVDHSSVSIATAADSGLSGGGDITSTRNLAVDVNGTTAETTVAGADELLLYDASATALRKMTRTNFVLSESEVDAFVGNNGYLTSESDPGLQTLTTAEVDQLENIDSTTISATQWGYLGAMGGQPLESESDTLAAVTGRGASTTDAITIDGAADAVQLTIQGHSTQTTNVNILELENSAGTVVGSFRADGATTASTDLATKSYVDSQVSGSGDVSGAANVGGQTGELFRDEVTGTLNFKTIGAGSSKLSVTNNANDISLDVVEANIDHDSLSGFVANEHVDHSSVSIATAADSGLSGGGNITATRNLAVDITGTTAEASIASGDELLVYDASATALRKMTYSNFVSGLVTNGSSVGAGGVDVYKQNNSGVLEFKSVNNGAGIAISNDVVNDEVDVAVDINGSTAETTVAGADELLIYDASATGIRKMTRTNFVLSESEVDAFVGNNGYLTSYTETDPGLQTLTTAEVDQLETIDSVTITNAQWGYLGAMTGQPLESESDPGLQTLTTAEVDQLENIGATTISATQWGYLGGLAGAPLTSESDTLAAVTGRGASTTDAITIDGAADAVQLTIQGHSTQTTNVNILELENSAGTVVGSFRADGATTASTDLATKSYVDSQVSGSGDVSGAANVGGQTGELFRDEVTGTLNFKTIGAGSSKLSVTNNTNDISLDVVEANIDHDSLSGFVANEHVDHSSVSIATAADSGLSGGGNITATRNLAVDINGTTAESSIASGDELLVYDASATALRKMTYSNFVSGLVTNGSSVGTGGVDVYKQNNSGVLEFKSVNNGAGIAISNDVVNDEVDVAVDINGSTAETTVAGADELLIYDASATGIRKMTRTNFVLSESEVDAFVGNNGYLTSYTETDPGLQTLTTAEVDQLETIDSVTITNAQWGYLGAMTGQPLESESDPGLQTLTTAEVDQLENIGATTISATQWGYLGGLAGAPLTSESDTLAAVTGRGASTTDAITIDGAADAVQLTIQGHSTQTTNVNILELENSAGTVVGSFRADGVTTATTDLATKSYVDAQVSGSGDVTGAANVGAGTGQIFRDETSGTLNMKTIAAGSTKLSVTNNANDVTLDVVEANINHDNLSGFVANEHVDHSSVSIATAADSGLSGGGDITSTRNLAVDVNGTTAETTVAGADELLLYDASATALRKMTRTNFVLSESEVDAFVGNNGYLTSESDPGLQTLTTAEVDQLENIGATTVSATQWGYLGAMGGQPLESESDPGLQTLTTAEVDQLENIGATTVSATQWGYLGGLAGAPLTSESDPGLQTLTTAEVDQLENIGATTVSATQWGYLGAMAAQPLEASSDVDHGSVTGLADDDHTQYALLAGRSGGQTLTGGTAANNDLTLESTSNVTKGDIILQPTSGKVGIGESSPTATLEVDGQIASQVHNNGASTTFNFNNGNMQYTSANCGAMTLQNMVDGATYTVAVQGTTSGTCTFSHSGDTFKYSPTNGATTAATETIYTFVKMGSTVYVSWITGFN